MTASVRGAPTNTRSATQMPDRDGVEIEVDGLEWAATEDFSQVASTVKDGVDG
jgi:hypothetical protein